jgi:hypothetical protein
VQYGKALKKLMAVDKHFADIMEDQFDFHSYCLRKMTLRAYLRMLRCVTVTATASHACLRCRLGRCVLACSLEDGLYGHEYFVSAAYGLVTAYLAIFDKPKQSAAAAQAEAEAALSDSERKKLENKRKKAALKVARLGPPALAPRPLRCLRLRLHARAKLSLAASAGRRSAESDGGSWRMRRWAASPASPASRELPMARQSG